MQIQKLSKEEVFLYFVTNKDTYLNRELYFITKEAIMGGASIVQYREKNKSYEKMKKECILLKALCDEHSVKLIINDHVKLAKDIDAHGVHIGQDDEDFSNARNILGQDKIIGVSVFNETQAIKAQRQGADYLGVGAIFKTNSKSDAKQVSIDVLKNISEIAIVPVVGIGGINLNNIEELKNANIDGVALISAIINNKDIKNSTKIMHKKISQVLNKRDK